MSLFTLGDCVADGNAWFKQALDAKFGGGGYAAYYEVVLEFFASIDEARCDAAIEAMAEHGTYFTPTLGMELNDRSRVEESAFAYMPPAAREWCATTLAGIDAADAAVREAAYAAFTSFTKRLQESGVTLLAGSDNPNYCLVPGFSLHWELERLVEAGLSPLAALQTATINAAAALGRKDTEGRIAAGYQADLVLLEANPLENIRHTQRIAGVVSNGRWLDSQAIQSMLAAARDAADTVE